MLGAGAYKKRIDKNNKKKARKAEESGAVVKRTVAPSQATSRDHRQSGTVRGAGSEGAAPSGERTVFSKPKTTSTLKGPIVSSPHVQYAYDSGNKGMPANFSGSGGGRGAGGRGRGRGGFTPQHQGQFDEPSTAQAPRQQNVATSASSRAQKKKFSRASGDDLLDQFKAKLSGSTFRLLNEQLYNSPNAFAQQLLKDQGTFEDYHNGYRWQLSQWPIDPNQIFIDALLGDKKGHFLQNSKHSLNAHSASGAIPQSWVIADMGCGDAKIAKALKPKGYTVHSFDLCASDANKDHITVASSARTPLASASCDVVMFSLSLMATDWFSSILEAHRVLKPKRILKIIEVRSRIPNAQMFAEVVANVGFTCEWQDVVGNYFVAFDFIRNELASDAANPHPVHHPNDVLLPSMYKKR